MMTVKELRDIMDKLPDDSPVLILDTYWVEWNPLIHAKCINLGFLPHEIHKGVEGKYGQAVPCLALQS
jgi:hypothetical protein